MTLLLSDFIEHCHDDGLTIIQTIKCVVIADKMKLREAKDIVSAHAAWANVVEAAQPLHADAETALMSDHEARDA